MLLIMMDRSDEKVQAGVLPLNYSRSTWLDYHSAALKTTAEAPSLRILLDNLAMPAV
jgi:hypothetical protein